MLSRFFLLLVLIGAPHLAPSQILSTSTSQDGATTPTGEIRIGFVDMDVVLQDSRAVWEALREVDEEMERRERDLLAKMRELRRLQQRFEQQGGALSPEARRSRELEIINLLDEVEEEEYRFGRDVRDKEAAIVGPLRRFVLEVVGQTARRKGYDMVLSGEMVLYATPVVDLTPAVIEALETRGEDLQRLVRQPTRRPTSTEEAGPELPALTIP
ncbi:MAG: OmpH family outer membrane protein [Candidatus Sumerlaeia bacterium]|nr:OmpH family outer membrane protein [Candidatus Sumerlaeia bacterium]